MTHSLLSKVVFQGAVMFGVKFYKSMLEDPSRARSIAVRKLANGIKGRERIDLVRTKDGYKLTRRSVLFGKGGVTREARKFLHALNLYSEKESSVPVGAGESLSILSANIDQAVMMERRGFLWKSPEEMYTPIGFVAGKSDWRVVQQAGEEKFFVVIDKPAGRGAETMRSNFKAIIGEDAKFSLGNEVNIGGVAKILVPFNESMNSEMGKGRFPAFVHGGAASNIVFGGKAFRLEGDPLGHVGGKMNFPIRKGIAPNGSIIVLKPLTRRDSPEVMISEKVGDGKSKNILRCYGSMKNPNASGDFLLVSEYASGGTAFSGVEDIERGFEGGMLTRAEAKMRFYGIAHQMCLGVQQFHARGYKHLDLKPDNFYIVPDENGEPVVKLADFGTAAEENYPVRTARSDSLNYMSPEMRTVWDNGNNRAKATRGEQITETMNDPKWRGTAEAVERLQKEKLQTRVLDKKLPPVGLESDVFGLVKSLSELWLMMVKWLGADTADEAEFHELILGGLANDPSERPTAKVLAERFANLLSANDAGVANRSDP